MTNSYDLIALSVIAFIAVTGGCFVATQPIKPSKREESEKALLAKLEKFDEWICQNPAPSYFHETAQAAEILEHDTVALLETILEQHLVRGQVGTVLKVLAPGVLLVEFARAKDGCEIATKAVAATKLLKLWHELGEGINLSGRTA